MCAACAANASEPNHSNCVVSPAGIIFTWVVHSLDGYDIGPLPCPVA